MNARQSYTEKQVRPLEAIRKAFWTYYGQRTLDVSRKPSCDCCFFDSRSSDLDFVFSRWGRRILHFAMLICNSLISHTFLIAINRCIIITLPLHYKSIFSPFRTNIHISLCWITAAAFSAYNLIDPCHQTIVESDQPLFFGKPECGLLVNVIDFAFPTVVMGSTIVVDLFSLYKVFDVLKTRKQLTKVEAVRRRYNGREVQLCYMILTQVVAGIFVYFTITIGSFIENEFSQFLATSFTWSLAQALDGYVNLRKKGGLTGLFIA
uniref:7TM_GPCR_Srx domain-containing protein n=1 Tax=Steinernema glaseri TaxID=37863 RepID=A0A1I7YJM2_9BILA